MTPFRRQFPADSEIDAPIPLYVTNCLSVPNQIMVNEISILLLFYYDSIYAVRNRQAVYDIGLFLSLEVSL